MSQSHINVRHSSATIVLAMSTILLFSTSPHYIAASSTYHASPTMDRHRNQRSILEAPIRRAKNALSPMAFVHRAHMSLAIRGGETTEETDVSLLDTSITTTSETEEVHSNDIDVVDEMSYATIGILDLVHSDAEGDIIQSNSKILLSTPGITSQLSNEWWGVDSAYAEQGGGDAEVRYNINLAVAEMMGCLCHGMVLHLPLKISDSTSLESNQLDDVLYCIAEGMIRRLKSATFTSSEVILPLVLAFSGEHLVNNDQDEVSNVHEYIQAYLDLAIQKAWEHRQGGMFAIAPKCKVKVHCADTSIAETAAWDLAVGCTRVLAGSYQEQVDSTSDKSSDWLPSMEKENLSENLVPQRLFGVLATKLMEDYKATSVRWEKLTTPGMSMNGFTETTSVDGNPSTDMNESEPSRQISPEFRDQVEMLMAVAFVDAEELLYEIENKLDGALLDGDHETTLPEFASYADAMLGDISLSFATLFNAVGSLADDDLEWAEGE